MDRVLVVGYLEATPGLLRRLTADLSPELATTPPKPGEWSITEVVRHLVEGDRDTFLPRLRRMLAEERPVFESRSRQASADRADLPTLLAAFESARAQGVKTLNGLEPAAWRREGVSPSRGPLSVEAYAGTMAAHDTEHLQQIHQVRSGLGLRPKRTRRQTVAFLESLPPGAAERTGLTPAFGPVTLAIYATHIVDHDTEHLAQMEACRNS